MKPTIKLKKRALLILVAVSLVGFGVIVARLFLLQIVSGEEYQEMAINQQLRDTEIAPSKGTIYDRNMKTLAASATVWTVIISPNDIDDDDRELIAKGLSEILDMDYQVILDDTYKENYYEIVKRKVELPIADEVREFALENKIYSITLAEDSKRYYPYGNFAAAIIGFTGTDSQGLSGLESYFDETLTGTAGRIVSARTAWGDNMPFSYEQVFEAEDGNSLVLTIDETLQHFLEKHLETAVIEHNVQNGAAGIAINPKTGEILAMAVKPDYDPNDPFTLSEDMMAAINEMPEDVRSEAIVAAQNAQWRNKIISDLYEPGSVFKIVTASAALEENVAQTTDTFYCSGSAQVGPETMRCHKLEGHGNQSFVEAVFHSCNPAFIELGSRLGSDDFYKYFEAFGFTERTGITLPGEAHSIFYTAEDMGPVELASSSFGQSNKVTPLQMIMAAAAAVNGGYLMEPYIVSRELDEEGNIVSSTEPTVVRSVISKETSETIAQILEQNVAEGGGKNSYIPGYRIGGKSGTSQKLDSENEDARIASFLSFAPADDPEIMVLIYLDEPDSYTSFGSTITAPVVRAFLEDALPYLGIQPQYTEEEAALLDQVCPSLIGRELSSAKITLNSAGFTYTVVGDGDEVLNQIPLAGQSLPRGSNIVLYTEETEAQTAVVPNLIGMSAAQANSALVAAGFNIRVEGNTDDNNAFVTSQDYSADVILEKGSIITVTLVTQIEE